MKCMKQYDSILFMLGVQTGEQQWLLTVFSLKKGGKKEQESSSFGFSSFYTHIYQHTHTNYKPPLRGQRNLF